MALFLRRLKQQPQNILVARTDRVGDFVLTLPVFEALARAGLTFTVLCRGLVQPLLENNPYVDRIIIVDEPGQDPVSRISRRGFDALLVLVNDAIIRGLLPELRQIPVRIGPLSRLSVFPEYTHPVIQKRSRSIMNEAAYNLELLAVLGIENEFPIRPKLYITAEEKASFTRKLVALLGIPSLPALLVVVHQGMGGSALNWPENHYHELVSGLVGDGVSVLLSGSGETEARLNRKLMDRFDPKERSTLFDLTNELSLRELAVLCAVSNLFIGPSTGPTHMAAAAGIPVISFYPPIRVQSSTRWGPYLNDAVIFTPDVDCGRKYKCRGEKCRHSDCMQKILPEAVLNQAREILGYGPA